jgi:hypothetical protein
MVEIVHDKCLEMLVLGRINMLFDLRSVLGYYYSTHVVLQSCSAGVSVRTPRT